MLKAFNDDTYGKQFNNGKEYTIDLNGHSMNISYFWAHSNSKLNIVDNSANHAGSLNVKFMQCGYTEKLYYQGYINFKNVKVKADEYMLVYYGGMDFDGCTVDAYISVNGVSEYSTKDDVHTSITAKNTVFDDALYLAGFGIYNFSGNTFNEDFPLYFKAGNINLTNNVFNVACDDTFDADYIYYGNGAFSQATAIMIDEAPGYKGFGTVNIGEGNSFNFTGDHADSYYQVMYNIIPNSAVSANVTLGKCITKSLTAKDYVAKRDVSFTDDNKEVNCVAYFASMEHANAFEDNFKNNNSSYTSITIGEIVNLTPVNPT